VIGSGHGVEDRSAINFDNLITVPQRALIRRVGALSDAEMVEACDALALALGCS
jgi:mRNA-degrading endonuclease toxin of MazEF toxin-antitoxin module